MLYLCKFHVPVRGRSLGYAVLAVSGELQYLCGGSLITDMYVLTAAHCIASTFNNSSVKL
jgi:secreted trypsin-like serine protease